MKKFKKKPIKTFLNNIKLSTKLGTGFFVIFLLLLGFLSILKISNNKLIKEFEETKFKVESIRENNTKTVLMQISSTKLTNSFLKNIVLFIDTKDTYEAKTYMSKASSGLDSFITTYKSVDKNLNGLNLVKIIEKNIDQMYLIKELEINYIEAKKFQEAQQARESLMDIFENKILTNLDEINFELTPLLDDLNLKNTFSIDDIVEVSELNINKIKRNDILSISLISFMLFTIFILGFISYSSTKILIETLTRNIDNLAQLNLSIQKENNNNLSFELRFINSLLNKMISAFKDTIIEIDNKSLLVKKESKKISDTVSLNGASSEEIFSSVSQIKENINVSVEQVVYMAEQSEQMHKEATKMIESFAIIKQDNENMLKEALIEKKSIENTTVKVNEIRDEIENNIEDIESLKSFSNEINGFIKVIYGITEQTSLLSLNAAIEAARAGESGKGFSVVAGEIRKLAENSRNTAEDIENKIKTISSKIDVTVKNSYNSKIKMKEMDSEIKKVEIVFFKLMDVLSSITKSLELIFDDTKHQSFAMENLKVQSKKIEVIFKEIYVGVEEINHTIFSTSQSINELIEVSEALVENSNKVNDSIEKFKF